MLIVDIPSLIVAPFTESEGGREQKVEKGFESGNCIGLSNNRHLRKIFVRKSTAWQISHLLVNFMTKHDQRGEKRTERKYLAYICKHGVWMKEKSKKLDFPLFGGNGNVKCSWRNNQHVPKYFQDLVNAPQTLVCVYFSVFNAFH